MESRDGTGNDWKSLSVTLFKTGKFQQLRTLLAKTKMQTGLSWQEICEPSQYSWKDKKFVRNKGKGGEYGLLMQVMKRLNKKARLEKSRRVFREIKVIRRRESELKATMDLTRNVLSENITENRHLRNCLQESNVNQRKLKSMYVNVPHNTHTYPTTTNTNNTDLTLGPDKVR